MSQSFYSPKGKDDLTSQDFLAFGLEQIAYIKQKNMNDEIIYNLHAADGTLLSTFESEEQAASGAMYNSLAAVIVH
jgi:hypothetical protein